MTIKPTVMVQDWPREIAQEEKNDEYQRYQKVTGQYLLTQA